MKFMKGNCQQIRILEELLSATLGNRMVMAEDGVHNELWKEQLEFESAVYVHKYRLTAGSNVRWLCKWFDIAFYYDKRPDANAAFIDLNRDNIDSLQELIDAAAEKRKTKNNHS